MHNLTERATEFHKGLPGLGRALLNDLGVSNEVIDRHEIGWDGEHFTIPVRRTQNVVFFERWAPECPGEAVGLPPTVMLWNRRVLEGKPYVAVFCEGVLDALILESHGLAAVAATDTGRYFKTREWKPLFESLPEVIIAFPFGDNYEQRKHMLSRHDVRMKISEALQNATHIEWPELYERDHGVPRFFIEEKRNAEEFLTLPRQ